MKTLYLTLVDYSGDISNTWGWVAGGMVYFVDHWSGFAAFLLFATQLAINVRKLLTKKE